MNLRELSDLLGLSPTTVSRALNGYPEVRAETRARVAEAAAKHGYAPNFQAKKLATGRSMSIGHVVPTSRHEMINPIFGDFIAGAGETYSKRGYDMVITVVEDDGEEAAYRSIHSQHKVDGIIVHGPRQDDPRVPLLNALGVPYLVHGRVAEGETGYSWLDINNKRAFERATNLLLDLGHRRIAFLNGLENMHFAQRRRVGHEIALTERGVPVDPEILFAEEMTEPFGYETTRRLLAAPNPPTAILTSSLITAMGVSRALSEMGLQLGRDISVITHDDELSFLPNAGDVPLFTCTRSSVRAAGSRVAELLIDLIDSEEKAHVSELWECQLTLGRSTGPAPT